MPIFKEIDKELDNCQIANTIDQFGRIDSPKYILDVLWHFTFVNLFWDTMYNLELSQW